jgi:hypothetical protein
MVQWFLENLEEPFPNSKAHHPGLPKNLEEFDIANATWLAAAQAKGIKESTDFVARVLHLSNWPQGFRRSNVRRILLASPLYVASGD